MPAAAPRRRGALPSAPPAATTSPVSIDSPSLTMTASADRPHRTVLDRGMWRYARNISTPRGMKERISGPDADLGRRLSKACRHEPLNARRSCAARCSLPSNSPSTLPGVHWRVRPHRDPRSHDCVTLKDPRRVPKRSLALPRGPNQNQTIVTITEPETARLDHDHDHPRSLTITITTPTPIAILTKE